MCFCCILVYNSALVVTGDPSEMSLVITFGRLMLLLSLLYCQHANTMNCDYPDEKPCLNVFDSEPQGNPKCYCTNLCPISLEELKKNCTSGQLLPDECSVCLQCAKTRGQACGGYKNRRGQCGLGLRCLVRFNVPRGSDGRDEENSGEGKCVAEDSPLCPDAGVKHLEDGINCRPGRLGIVSEALYCPLISKPEEETDSSSSADDPVTTDKRPSLVAILLSNVPNPFDF